MTNQEQKGCWNCGVAEEMRLSGTFGDKRCIFAELMMRNPCRGWKSVDCIGDGVEEALKRFKEGDIENTGPN